jgi:hypothetical protein
MNRLSYLIVAAVLVTGCHKPGGTEPATKPLAIADPPAEPPKQKPEEPTPAVPLEPVGAILDAFRTHPVVALDEGHHTNEPGANFRLKLLRDPRFPTVVNDIVVECGNALYQDVMDRFVAGDEVPDDTLKQMWQNTSQPHDVWDHVCYEEFFNAVRALNSTLPKDRKLRVLLGDPPFDWSKVRNAKDYVKTLEGRDSYPADLIKRETLAKERRALVVYGGMHLLRRESESIVDQLELGGTKVFTIWVNSFCDLELVQDNVRTWQEPSLFLLKGTIPGAADFTVFYPFNGDKAAPKRRMDERADAMLYLGHPLTFSGSPSSPGLSTDEKYLAMRKTRIGYLNELIKEYGGDAPPEIADWAADFRARSKQPPPVLPRLWRTYVAKGMAAALASLPKDSKEIPQGDEALNKFSEAVLKRGKIDDAIAAASKNAELFPTVPGPCIALGAANSAKGYRAQAVESYRRALKLDPGNKDATEALAKLGSKENP